MKKQTRGKFAPAFKGKIVLVGEDLYKKRDTLKKVFTDKEKWLVFYIDEKSGEKWVEEFPYAEMHGGGPPLLRLINEFPWDQPGEKWL